jgi:hypothetical protein
MESLDPWKSDSPDILIHLVDDHRNVFSILVGIDPGIQ